MFHKTLLTTTLAASLVAVPVSRVQADAGDFLGGLAVGVIGSAVARDIQRKNQAKRYYRSSPAKKVYRKPSIPSTAEGRQIQSSLNYFGFNAGTVDGQLGRRSREAVSAYQGYMGYPVTGELTSFEQNLLISSYNRAQAGGYATQQQVAATPDGVRGLLKTYRAEMAGGAPATVPQTTVVVAPAAPPAVAAPVAAAPSTLTTTTTTVTALGATAAAAAPKGGLTNLFGGQNSARLSLASHCNTVSLLTSTNGGFTTVSTMSDPNVVLNEQFCLARTYAIADGERLAQGLPATQEQIAEHCAAYGEQMRPHVAALAVKSREEVVRDVSSFVLGTGISTQDLAATAKVCLSNGYRIDDLDEALGSALILVSLGQAGYGELMGHHLSQGFGTAKRADLAAAWYDSGLEGATTQAVFAPGQPERVELLRKASTTLQSGGAASLPAAIVPQKASSLPTFSAQP
ncbi:peptidoglycan-binding domain-containing protein [Oceaniglobus roseus]|uniref:peptidoglycan-binding domain-containing protein n=1 Tax=Oceaniglobus roseus TaxID=1737570 RepID=UPI00130013E1|nr:peptidoglycan-binding domain-containing protein [Kandeliimicrobium roseum]